MNAGSFISFFSALNSVSHPLVILIFQVRSDEEQKKETRFSGKVPTPLQVILVLAKRRARYCSTLSSTEKAVLLATPSEFS